MLQNDILATITRAISGILHDTTLIINENAGQENSIVVRTSPSPYQGTKELLFCRIKPNGQNLYISFSAKYKKLFECENIPVYQIASQPNFIRIKIDDFFSLSEDATKMSLIMSRVFRDLFTTDAFGCCDLYMECSDKKECTHPDNVYAMSCQYRSNLENGRIFYGVNKNYPAR